MLGSEAPPLAVICDPEDDPPGVRFFSVIWSDAPPTGEVDDSPLVCAHCLLEEHPDLGRSLDIAQEHRCAERDPVTGEWRECAEGRWL